MCPSYSAIRDVPDAKCVTAYARARTAAEAHKVLDFFAGNVNDRGPRLCRDAPLAAMRWDAPRPGVLQGIPRAPPPEVRVEVTRRYIGECERASAPPPPARSLGNDRRAEESRHRRFLREPVAAERASADSRSRNPEWLGPNRCAVDVCGQMGRLIGPNGTCVIDTVKETGCEISKLDDERVVVEGATQTLVERGVERVRDLSLIHI